MKLEKSKWRKVKFGDVVYEDKKTVDAKSSGLERYIAGEHMNTEDLHLRSWGIIGEDYLGPAFHRKFEKGDLLYGSRRTYLKKVAIADFDGITSNTTFVLKENKDMVVQGFIPFLMLSDRFTEHSVKHSKGSVNPYINFKDLAKFEFLLPPIDQQEKLAELLWAGDDLIQRQLSLNSVYITATHSVLNDLINQNIEEGKEYYLGQLGQTFGGLTGKTKLDFGRGKPFITYMNVFKNSKLNIQEVDLCEIGDNENQNTLKFGDIFFTGSSETPEEVGMAAVLLDKPDYDVYLNSFCFGFRLHSFEILLPEFARFLFRAKYVRDFMHLHAQGSTRFNLSKTTVKDKLKLYIPPKKRQKEIIEKLEQIVTLEENMKLSFSKTIAIVSEINKKIFNS